MPLVDFSRFQVTDSIKVKKSNGKAMSLTCQNCGTKHYL